MNLEADIKWIQKELDDVKDPDLIEAFKHLLKFRKKSIATTIEDYNNDIAESERDIESGRIHTQSQIEKLNEVWKNSL